LALDAFALRLNTQRRVALQAIHSTHVRQVVWSDRLNHVRRDEEHQLCFFLFERLRLEQIAEHGDLADDRNSRERLCLRVVEQTCERERLSITQLDASLGATSAQCRNYKTVVANTVVEVDRGNFRFEFQPDVVFVDDGRFEVQANAILFPNDRDRLTSRILKYR